jgi:glutamine cyclotransferase
VTQHGKPSKKTKLKSKRARAVPSQKKPIASPRGREFSKVGFLLPGAVLAGITGYVVWGAALHRKPVADGYRVVATLPHDSEAFTQGLVIEDGALYESSGGHGKSSLRRVSLSTGEVLQKHDLDTRLFGEGITIWKNRIVQLTWQAGVGIVYDLATLQERFRFSYRGEGWGLTHDGTHLIMSDGSPRLRFIDPESIQEGKEVRVVRTIRVRDRWRLIARLNELEFIDGEIYANIYETDRIVRISPASGEVLGIVKLDHLHPARERPWPHAVLNGIAHDRQTGKIYITGKLWPHLYEIDILPGDGPVNRT